MQSKKSTVKVWQWLLVASVAGLMSACATSPRISSSQLSPALAQLEKGRTETAIETLSQLCRDQKVAGACALLGHQAPVERRLSVLQGITTDNMSQFTVVVPKDEPVAYLVAPLHKDAWQLSAAQVLSPVRTQKEHSNWAVDRLVFKPNTAASEYVLLIVGGERDELLDRREFALANIKKATPEVAIASCMDDTLDDHQENMWGGLLSHDSDYVFLIGDNVYADKAIGVARQPDPELLWKRYVETRNELPYYKAERLRPTLATWDDHDYGANNMGKNYEYKKESAETFAAFFAQQGEVPGTYVHGPGISSALMAYGQNFVFMDARYFRDIDDPKGTHWGQEQEKWMLELMRQHPQPTWIINGDQIFGGYHRFESYEGHHPQSLERMKNNWRQLEAPVLFVSGDRHLSEIMRVSAKELGYVTYELTSSGIHAPTYPESDKDSKNPRRIAGVAGPLNYMIVNVESTKPRRLKLKAVSYTLNGKPLFQKTLTVQK